MNNAEWAIEHKPELFDLFDCPQCSKHDGEKCTRPDGLDFDRQECAKGHFAWLMRPHESSLEAAQTGDCDKDECEPAETENASQGDADSRARLERDIRGSLGFTTKDVFGWLDRQVAITEHEREQHWLELIGASANCNLELKRQIDELQNRKCPGYEPENHRCRYYDVDFELNADRLNDLKRENARLEKRIAELEETARRVNEADSRWEYMRRDLETMTAERDYWRGLYKQSHAENAAETRNLAENPQKTPEQQHTCDTCRWFERVSDDTGYCHRYPREVEKWPDDRCGEWSK